MAVVLYLGFSVYVFLNSKDDTLKDDSDLRLANIVVPVSENAYFDFIDVAKNIEFNNAKAVESYIKASTKTKYQNPIWADRSKIDFNTEVGNIAPIRTMANQLIAESKTLAAAGKIDEAIEKDLVVVRVGQLLNGSKDNLATWLVGLRVESMGLEEIARIKPDYKLPASLLTNQSKKGLEQTLKAEYTWISKYIYSKNDVLNSMFGVSDSNSPQEAISLFPGIQFFNSNYYYKVKETSNLMTDRYRVLVRNTQVDCGSQLEKPVMFLSENKLFSNPYLYMVLVENGLGKFVADTSYVSLEGLTEKQCNLEALRNKLR